jgi:hypothetical protein
MGFFLNQNTIFHKKMYFLINSLIVEKKRGTMPVAIIDNTYDQFNITCVSGMVYSVLDTINTNINLLFGLMFIFIKMVIYTIIDLNYIIKDYLLFYLQYNLFTAILIKTMLTIIVIFIVYLIYFIVKKT